MWFGFHQVYGTYEILVNFGDCCSVLSENIKFDDDIEINGITKQEVLGIIKYFEKHVTGG